MTEWPGRPNVEGWRFVFLSAAEGENNSSSIQRSSICAYVAVITKLDLAAAADFDETAVRGNIQSVRPGMEVFKVFAKAGEGMSKYFEFVAGWNARSRAAAAVGAK